MKAPPNHTLAHTSSTPTAPYFSCNSKRHAIDFSQTVETRLPVSQSILVSDADAEWVTFDAAGGAWGFRYERPHGGFSFVRRLLTKTVSNPTREVALFWTHLRPYPLSELRDAYLDAIEHDDDILTQFVEREELLRRVQQSQNFHDLVETWRWMETEPAHETPST
jgi:hypothetical protein